MPVFLKDNQQDFPNPEMSDEDGIIAVGGDLNPARLVKAYSAGIFPWPHQGLPLLWFCPDPRFVLVPKNIIISRSLRKAIKHSTLTIRADTDFLSVIKNCQSAARPHQNGTWITPDIVRGYYELFNLGLAHSIEAYQDDKLVGGLYGVSLGGMYFGESMFFKETNASKICFITLVAHLILWDFSLIDCQAPTENLERFGAKTMSRSDFLAAIQKNNRLPTKKGPWHLNLTPLQALELLTSIA